MAKLQRPDFAYMNGKLIPWDDAVLHVGCDPENPEDLGATIDFGMGDEYVRSNSTFGMWVPKGLKHGPLVWKKFERPHLELTIMIGAGTLAEADPGGHEKLKRGAAE